MPILNSEESSGAMMRDDLRSAMEFLERRGLAVAWSSNGGSRDTGVDGTLWITVGEVRWATPFIYKSQLRPSTLGMLRVTESDALVVSHHVTPNVAASLRERGVNYLDAAGNAHIRTPGLVLEIEGRKPEQTRDDSAATSIFTMKSLPVVLALLNRPDLISAPMREIQLRTDVSLGTVQRVLESLRRDGYEAQTWSRTADRDRWRRLLEGWVAAYLAGPRARLTLNRYRTDKAMLHDVLGIVRSLPVAVSGEAAAEMLGYSIRPTTLDLYVHGSTDRPEKLMQAARLRADPQGWITVRRAMWTGRTEQDADRATSPPLAPAPVLYADLVGVGDPRLDGVSRELVRNDPHLRPFFD